MVPPPSVAYLRVYEPLSAFTGERRARMIRAVEVGPLDVLMAGERERELWMRAQLSVPPRLLPAERSDGTPSREGPADVLVLAPADVPSGSGEPGADGPLVCPLDVRSRSAAALLGFLTASMPALQVAVLSVPPVTARGRAEAVMGSLAPGAVHVVSSTWTVPLPWFAIVDPAARVLDAAPRPDPARRVSWRVTMTDARSRVARAHTITRDNLGEEGPAGILRDTGRWLQHFHARSVVELDYGGLAQLIDDDVLESDTSAADVHAAVDALEAGDTATVAATYERLRDFWTGVAAAERTG